jgi:hypothetical protein
VLRRASEVDHWQLPYEIPVLVRSAVSQLRRVRTAVFSPGGGEGAYGNRAVYRTINYC